MFIPDCVVCLPSPTGRRVAGRLATLAVVALSVVPSGCTTVMQATPTEQVELPSSARGILEAQSLAGIDDSLHAILTGDDAQRDVESLIVHWGRHGNLLDLAVMRILFDHWPTAYSRHSLSPEPLIELVEDRLAENPELLHQFGWYVQWRLQIREFRVLCERLRYPGPDVRIEGEIYTRYLFATSLTCGPMRSRTNLKDHEEDTYYASIEFLASHPYQEYDRSEHRYVLNRDAERDQRYLGPAEQNPTLKMVPLPDWNQSWVPPLPGSPVSDL